MVMVVRRLIFYDVVARRCTQGGLKGGQGEKINVSFK